MGGQGRLQGNEGTLPYPNSISTSMSLFIQSCQDKNIFGSINCTELYKPRVKIHRGKTGVRHMAQRPQRSKLQLSPAKAHFHWDSQRERVRESRRELINNQITDALWINLQGESAQASQQMAQCNRHYPYLGQDSCPSPPARVLQWMMGECSRRLGLPCYLLVQVMY